MVFGSSALVTRLACLKRNLKVELQTSDTIRQCGNSFSIFPNRAQAGIPQPFIESRNVAVEQFSPARFQCGPLSVQFLHPIERRLVHTRDVTLCLIDEKQVVSGELVWEILDVVIGLRLALDHVLVPSLDLLQQRLTIFLYRVELVV